jgi:phosphoribosylglycinamide formyltransferase-1
MNARIAILASGGGTTAEAFIRSSLAQQLDVSVSVVIASRYNAGIIERLVALNQELGLTISSVVINSTTHPAIEREVVQKGSQTLAEQQAILQVLSDNQIDLVALLGYMKRVGPELVTEYGWQPGYTSPYLARMINSHPGPLPATRALYGEGVQQRILDLGLSQGCQTLHLVAADYDDGPILAEHCVDVEPNDTAETLFARIQVVEKQHIAANIATFWQQREQYLMTYMPNQEIRI